MKVICFDLDDTLCKEIDFLKSAYREIASYAVHMYIDTNDLAKVLEVRVYEAMMEAFQSGRNAFETLNSYLGLDIPVSELLQMYREHVPRISLEEDIRCTLDRLKAEGVLMSIVSDGRELTQWNKIRTLGLTKWIDESFIIINSSSECFKPSPCGYERLEALVRRAFGKEKLSFVYVGDNLKKDFIYPKQAGWKTICLKDDGRNIHKQDFESTATEAMPDRVIKLIKEL